MVEMQNAKLKVQNDNSKSKKSDIVRLMAITA